MLNSITLYTSIFFEKERSCESGSQETNSCMNCSNQKILRFTLPWDLLSDGASDVWSAAPDIANQAAAHNHVHAHSHLHSGHSHGIDMDHPILALNMTLVSIAVKEGLYWITKRAGEKTGSGLMKANAWHHRADAVSSVVALVGVGGSVLGIRFLDPLAGLLVSGMILKAGLESGYQSVLELVDAAIPSQQLEPYKRIILGVEGVKGYNRLRGRRAGSYLYLDVDVKVDPFSSVSAAHDVGENVRRQLQLSHPEVAEVFIHIEPATAHVSESAVNYQKNCTSSEHSNTLEQTDVEDTVSTILSSHFSEKMTVERITRHSLQGQIFLEIDVFMPPDTLMREAVEVAKEAEKKILEVVPSIHVSVQLRLGRPMPDL
ncbi:hypothetical protein ACS0TY_007758 [Phlomoides rotata]